MTDQPCRVCGKFGRHLILGWADDLDDGTWTETPEGRFTSTVTLPAVFCCDEHLPPES